MLQIFALVLFAAAGFAGDLFSGLPSEISPSYPEEQKFVRFGAIENLHAPLLARPKLDGGDGRSFSMADVFEEQFYARLPDGKRIIVSKGSDGLESWDYPPFTQVIHRILIRSVPRRIFELRIIWQREDGTWAYGLYAPKLVDGREDEAVKLQLLRQGSGAVQIDANIHGISSSGPVRITGNRINVQSCQRCHFMSTPARHQYKDHNSAGPCGFVGANPTIDAWAQNYERLHGHWPFRGR